MSCAAVTLSVVVGVFTFGVVGMVQGVMNPRTNDAGGCGLHHRNVRGGRGLRPEQPDLDGMR